MTRLLLLLLLLLTHSSASQIHTPTPSSDRSIAAAVDSESPELKQEVDPFEHPDTPAEEDEEDDDDDLDDLEALDAELEAAGSSAAPLAAKLLLNVNEQSVETVIGKYEYVLLLGYAPWCTRSSMLMPEFAGVATTLAEWGSQVVLAKLDAINNPIAASRYAIRGFPTLLFFTNGSSEAYTGGNSRDEILIWLRKRTGFAATTIATKEEAEAFLSRHGPAVLGFFAKFEGPEYEAFIDAAKVEEGTEFVQTMNSEVAQMFIKPPFVALRKQEPEHFSAFGGRFTKTEISTFVELNKHPLVTVINSRNAGRVYSSPLKFHLLLFAEAGDYERVKSSYLDAAKEFKSKVMFLVVDLSDEDFAKPMLTVYGLQTDIPAVAGFNNENGSIYLLESEVTAESVKAFAADFLDGKLPLYYKSEPVPSENGGVVKIVVGKTFDEIVMDDAKDVFLQVYTPWCVACDKVNKSFEKLARHLQGVPSLVLAKLDASANGHPLLQELQSYPALFLYPAGRKHSTPASAPAQMSAKQLLQFVKDNVAFPFTLSKEEGKSKDSGKKEKDVQEVDVPHFKMVEVNERPKMETEIGQSKLPQFKESEETVHDIGLAAPEISVSVDSLSSGEPHEKEVQEVDVPLFKMVEINERPKMETEIGQSKLPQFKESEETVHNIGLAAPEISVSVDSLLSGEPHEKEVQEVDVPLFKMVEINERPKMETEIGQSKLPQFKESEETVHNIGLAAPEISVSVDSLLSGEPHEKEVQEVDVPLFKMVEINERPKMETEIGQSKLPQFKESEETVHDIGLAAPEISVSVDSLLSGEPNEKEVEEVDVPLFKMEINESPKMETGIGQSKLSQFKESEETVHDISLAEPEISVTVDSLSSGKPVLKDEL